MSDATVASPPGHILPVIVLSQFAGTSLWFAGNAVLPELQQEMQLIGGGTGLLTSAVQLGFILGTFCFAFLSLADRVSPRLLFLLCALLGAGANALVVAAASSLSSVLLLRVITGFLLAGIYPVGMKIATSWYKTDLGKAIGFLVGALVIGTAFPHLLRALGASLPWQTLLLLVSGLAGCGGILMYLLVPPGPYLGKGAVFSVGNMLQVFRLKAFRAAAFGYFGHMWELYTLWAFTPFIIGYVLPQLTATEVSWWSFWVIAAGAAGCIGGGYASQRWGSARVAFILLLLSGLCCLLSAVIFRLHAPVPVLLFMLSWGVAVAGDSPQFSTLNAQTAPAHLVGTALTVVISAGFAITIVSIQLMDYLLSLWPPYYTFTLLAAGPAAGLLSLKRLVNN